MNDRMRAMLYKHPAAIPVQVGVLPAVWKKHGRAMSEIALRYPLLFPNHNPDTFDYNRQPETYGAGSHTDAWGCVWENIADGLEAIVTKHPYPTRESLGGFKAPSVDAGMPHGFMFLRLTDLRGFEEMMVDFFEEPPELELLINTVLEYNLRQVDIRLANTTDEILYFGDDLGMQNALPMGPARWRKWLKPCYKAIYDRVHATGRYVFMHTDGCIHEIIPDLIECGVNIINPQIRANGLDRLEAMCKGKVCITLDLDRQLFPFCTPAEVRLHIIECVERMYLPQGGLTLIAECGPDVPLENIDAICAALVEVRGYSGDSIT